MRAWGYSAERAPMGAVEDDLGPYRLKFSQDAVWPPAARAYGGPLESVRQQAALALIPTLRLIVPTALLALLLAATFFYADVFLSWNAPAQSARLTVGDVILPMACFVLHLTNRRHGAAYALAQLLGALVICVSLMLLGPFSLGNWVAILPSVSRATSIFGLAFLLANFAGIVVFEGSRGPHWWTPPLLASLTAALVFSAIYYPAALAGADPSWPQTALAHFGLFLIESVLLMIPYGLLRHRMRPLSGLNG